MIKGNKTIQAISPKDLLIYLCLRRYRNSSTGVSLVSVAKLAKMAGASQATILSSLNRLKTLGHIEYQKHGRQNFYRFLSDIEASSYNFLDKKLSYSDKVSEAVKVACIINNDEQSDNSTIAKLKETIQLLQNQIKVLITELNSIKKCVSVITGQSYTPMDIT
nr:MAG TPA: winged helix-turn-helix domain protein [Caudoviricetes sp.]